MKFIKRSNLLQNLLEAKGSPDIKIITGIRRCGKSRLLADFMDTIREEDPTANIIFIDFRLLEVEYLQEYHALNSYVEHHYHADVNNYLCIDEVQMCPKFELAINSLHVSAKYDIYLTGSNAFLLSSDLATLFTGRFIEIKVFPFSFSEYCLYYAIRDGIADIQDMLDQYLIDGGLSGSYVYSTSVKRIQYINDVYTTILQRDLVEKYHLADSEVLPRLMQYVMDNVSNISSPNSLAQELFHLGIPANNHTISAYLDYLCNAFVLYKVQRYDVRGKKYLQSLNKYYIVDSGIRFAQLGVRNMDYGRVYENIVAIELFRRNYQLYVGKLYQKEVDFVAMRGSEKVYIQVSDDISSPETFRREYEPLLQIRDAYPKMILARTRHPQYDFQGIQVVDLATWLLNEQATVRSI